MVETIQGSDDGKSSVGPATDYYGGGYLISLWKTSVLRAQQLSTQNGDTKAVSFWVLMVDSGAPALVPFRRAPDRTVTVNGVAQTVKAFTVVNANELDYLPDGTIVAFSWPVRSMRVVRDGWEGMFPSLK